MAQITFHGDKINTSGNLPSIGDRAPEFELTGKDLATVTLASLGSKRVVLNIFPSIDTPVCAASVRRFNTEAAALEDTLVLCVSADLPFAVGRFCALENLERVVSGSSFRSPEFGAAYGVTITDGPLRGLLARALVVVENGLVTHSELVPEIAQEPDYEAALAVLR